MLKPSVSWCMPNDMKRSSRFSLLTLTLGLVLPVITSGAALAGPKLVTVEVPESSLVGRDQTISHILYLNRCKGGCMVQGGSINDSRINSSTIPGDSQAHLLTEFNGNDTEWNEIVQCVKEMYSPFDFTVTDVDPGTVTFHSEAMVGGLPGEVNMPNTVGGVSPAAGCSPINSVINFTFANSYPKSAGRALLLCGVIGQESAHGYGLDHELDCSSPMTYLPYCGQSFFRNANLKCGEDVARPCRCGSTQNSHATLQSIFGAGTPSTGNPKVKIESPMANATINGAFTVATTASDRRGIERLELWLNGYKWATYTEKRAPDRQMGLSSIPAPASVPNGVIDIEVKAFNDLQMTTTSSKVTVTKGAPCTTATSCATGQKCEAGKCFWDPPTAEIGAACEFAQFCKSGRCEDAGGGKTCTSECFQGVAGSCPDKYECIAAGATGLCFAAAGNDSTGCCSQDIGNSALLVNGGFAALLGLLVFGRRKRISQ
jgi:hypothetical protein